MFVKGALIILPDRNQLLKKCLILLPTAFLVVLLDQITKYYLVTGVRLYESFAVIEGFFNITHVRNPGAAFGFLAQASPAFRSGFFILVSVLAIVLILYYIGRSEDDEPGFVFALSLVLGGAAGNFIDRLRFGEVVDFLDLYWNTFHWPAFNIADSAISLGAFILILQILRRKKEMKIRDIKVGK
jgi:signal peptidase II